MITHTAGFRPSLALSLIAGIVVLLTSTLASANGFGESAPWQFQTTQDKVNKGAIVDLVERKKGGYYDSFKTTINNTNNTYIDKQFNCAVTSSAAGNAGENGMTAATSSPTVTNTGTNGASTNANAATNGVTTPGFPGVLYASANPNAGSLGNNQSNSGALNSTVSGSSTSSTSGAIAAGGGVSDQVLNSNQSNQGSQTSSVAGSTACNGPLVSN